MALAAFATLLYSATYATLAYLIPGYQSFKALEKKNPLEVAEWTQYWVVLSALYCLQYVVDFLLAWLPLYYLAKLFFIFALWSPSFKLAATIYGKAISPLLGSYEADIDRSLLELRTRATDAVGQHGAQLKKLASQASSQATVALKDLQQKAIERARAAKKPAAAETNGLHTE